MTTQTTRYTIEYIHLVKGEPRWQAQRLTAVRYATSVADARQQFMTQRFAHELDIVTIREDGVSDEDRRSFPASENR